MNPLLSSRFVRVSSLLAAAVAASAGCTGEGVGGGGAGGGGAGGTAGCPTEGLFKDYDPCEVEGLTCPLEREDCPGAPPEDFVCEGGVWMLGPFANGECNDTSSCGELSTLCPDGHLYPKCVFDGSDWGPYFCQCPNNDATAEGACDLALGWRWDGAACALLMGCSCVGSECPLLHPDEASCVAAKHC